MVARVNKLRNKISFTRALRVAMLFKVFVLKPKPYKVRFSFFHLMFSVCHQYTAQVYLRAQLVKNLPAMQETPVRFLGREDPLEKGQATHSSVPGLPLWLG